MDNGGESGAGSKRKDQDSDLVNISWGVESNMSYN